jgi:hypothetical protein
MDHTDYIARALACEGGHLSIGRGGFTLYFTKGATLSGHDCETIKAACIAAGLPVIDSRGAPIGRVARTVICGPMVAVGHAADPAPYHSLSYAPLADVAESYRAIGAEVFNLGPVTPRPCSIPIEPTHRRSMPWPRT